MIVPGTQKRQYGEKQGKAPKLRGGWGAPHTEPQTTHTPPQTCSQKGGKKTKGSPPQGWGGKKRHKSLLSRSAWGEGKKGEDQFRRGLRRKKKTFGGKDTPLSQSVGARESPGLLMKGENWEIDKKIKYGEIGRAHFLGEREE